MRSRRVLPSTVRAARAHDGRRCNHTEEFWLRASYPSLPTLRPRHTQLPNTHATSQHAQSLRSFSTSQALLKKKSPRREENKAAASSCSPEATTAASDPFDLTTLEPDIATAIERLKNDLSKLRAGGRFNPEVLENLHVKLDKSANQTVKLSDVAQVVPKGRLVEITVWEKDHVKLVTSTIQSSTLSLSPQPDPTGRNDCLLTIAIPPPTAESRKAALAEASKAGEKASSGVRDARAKQQKKLRGMQKDKSVRPDDFHKAGAMMEKVVEKGMGEVKRIVEGARRVLEGG